MFRDSVYYTISVIVLIVVSSSLISYCVSLLEFLVDQPAHYTHWKIIIFLASSMVSGSES